MSIAIRLVAPLLAAGAAAAIAGSPIAAAADNHLDCTYLSYGNSQCETPGNVQITATPQPVTYPQQYPYLYGGPVFIHRGPGGHR